MRLLLAFVLTLCILTPHFVNCQEGKSDEEVDAILKWQPPLSFQKQFPYFLSGFDNDGLPVWIAEFGKWDIRAVLEEGGQQAAEDFDKYTEQMWWRIYKSPEMYSTPDNPIENYVYIIDLEGYSSRQATHLPSVQKTVNIARQASHISRKRGKRAKVVNLVNSNFLFQTVYNLMKPILGELSTTVEIYGTNDRWKSILLQNIPKNQLPEWLGGEKDHKPLKVYG